jgi:hypothetical protein
MQLPLKLLVGEREFNVSKSQLRKEFPDCSLVKIFDNYPEGDRFFIDRDGDIFANIILYLRGQIAFISTKTPLELASIMREAKFYNLPELEKLCSTELQVREQKSSTNIKRQQIMHVMQYNGVMKFRGAQLPESIIYSCHMGDYIDTLHKNIAIYIHYGYKLSSIQVLSTVNMETIYTFDPVIV